LGRMLCRSAPREPNMSASEKASLLHERKDSSHVDPIPRSKSNRITNTLIATLYLIDNLNPIAWGKMITWFFHPGRFPPWDNTTLSSFLFIRFMFLLTNIINYFIQYIVFFLTADDQFPSLAPFRVRLGGWIEVVDGVKYSGFTNHVIQTFVLYRPQSRVARSVVNESRLYMQGIQNAACVCALFFPFLVEV
jgi:hypothetical protein